MNEEKKLNEKNILKTISNNFIQKEFQKSILKIKNPGFNMVSLKARQRLNLFKQLLSKYEYKDYIRKCKNMYSISSAMNNHYSMNDLYLKEKEIIPELINIFNRIDSKFFPKKVFHKKTKIKNSDSFSLSASIFFQKNNSLNIKNNKVENNNKNLNENKIILSYQRKTMRNKTIGFNKKNLDFLIFGNNIKRKSFNSIDIKNLIHDVTPVHQIFKDENINNDNIQFNNNNNKNISNSLEKKNNSSLKSERSPNNISFSPILPRFKVKVNHKKNNNINRLKLKTKFQNDSKDIKGITLKYYPLSNKNKNFSITRYGGIIYTNSILRNKGIDNFLPNYYSIPFLHKNKN